MAQQKIGVSASSAIQGCAIVILAMVVILLLVLIGVDLWRCLVRSEDAEEVERLLKRNEELVAKADELRSQLFDLASTNSLYLRQLHDLEKSYREQCDRSSQLARELDDINRALSGISKRISGMM